MIFASVNHATTDKAKNGAPSPWDRSSPGISIFGGLFNLKQDHINLDPWPRGKTIQVLSNRSFAAHKRPKNAIQNHKKAIQGYQKAIQDHRNVIEDHAKSQHFLFLL